VKPLYTVTLLSRDPQDPSTTTPVGTIEVETLGNVTVILTKDEMGSILLESETVSAPPEFMAQLHETVQTLQELHEQMGRMQIACQHALTDMFAIHKWLTR